MVDSSGGVSDSNLAPLFSHNELCSCTLPSLEQHAGSDSDDSDDDKVRLAVNGVCDHSDRKMEREGHK